MQWEQRRDNHFYFWLCFLNEKLKFYDILHDILQAVIIPLTSAVVFARPVSVSRGTGGTGLDAQAATGAGGAQEPRHARCCSTVAGSLLRGPRGPDGRGRAHERPAGGRPAGVLESDV